MTKIIIVDYSLKIVIAIINYNYHNLHWIMFIPLCEATALDKKMLKTLTEKLVLFFYSSLCLKCELYIRLVSYLNKKVQIYMVL